MFDLIITFYSDNPVPVLIHHIVDIHKESFSTVEVGKNTHDYKISPLLKKSLLKCFTSGEHCLFEHSIESRSTLYPLKNTEGNVVAIITIEDFVCNFQLHVTITMMLQIYQNFTKLIRDNERDTLTGLLNRKTFEHKINKVLEKMQHKSKRNEDKKNQLYYLAIFDIDHFKRVNDQF